MKPRYSPATLERVALIVLVLASAVFGLLTLLRYPQPFDDEAWNASRSWGMLQTGHPFGTMDAGAYENFPGYWLYFPRLGAWFHAVAIGIFGPELSSVRLVSLLFGILLMLAVYAIGKHLYNAVAGLLAATLFALSESFLYSSHLARHDIIVAALGFGAIALYFIFVSRTGSPKRISFIASVICGLFIGITPDIHLNGIIYFPVILALFVFDYRFSVLKQWSFWGFLAGIAIGVGYFYLVHLARYPESYFAIAAIGNPIPRTPPALTLNPRDWLVSLVSTFALFMDDWRSPLAVIAIIMLVYRRTPADKRLLVLSAGLLLAYAATIRYGNPHYAILITPVGDLLIAVLLFRLYQQRSQLTTLRGYAGTAAAWGLVGASVITNLSALSRDFDRSYEQILSQLRQVIPAGSSVLGFQIYWFARPEDPYYTSLQLSYFRRYYPQSTTDDALRYFDPDYIIVSENRELEYYLSPVLYNWALQPSDLYSPDIEAERMKEDKAFVEERGDLVTTMTTRWFGELSVYKVDLID